MSKEPRQKKDAAYFSDLAAKCFRIATEMEDRAKLMSPTKREELLAEALSLRSAGDHAAKGGQIEDQTAIHLGIEGEVEVVEGFLRIAKPGLLAPAFQQTSPLVA
jgi:hypothetical protein